MLGAAAADLARLRSLLETHRGLFAREQVCLLLQLLYACPTLTAHHRRGNAARVADLRARIRRLLTALGH